MPFGQFPGRGEQITPSPERQQEIDYLKEKQAKAHETISGRVNELLAAKGQKPLDVEEVEATADKAKKETTAGTEPELNKEETVDLDDLWYDGEPENFSTESDTKPVGSVQITEEQECTK